MTDFEQKSDIRRRTFTKRTIHSNDQFYDLEVKFVNDSVTIDITSSQQTRGHIGGREVIEKLIEDLKEIIKL